MLPQRTTLNQYITACFTYIDNTLLIVVTDIRGQNCLTEK